MRAENEQLRRERDRQRNAWVRDYPGGVNIAHTNYNGLHGYESMADALNG